MNLSARQSIERSSTNLNRTHTHLLSNTLEQQVLAPLRLSESAELCKECVDALSTISKSQLGAKALVDRGATRQMLKTMADTSDKMMFEACHLEMLNAFGRVASGAFGRVASLIAININPENQTEEEIARAMGEEVACTCGTSNKFGAQAQ